MDPLVLAISLSVFSIGVSIITLCATCLLISKVFFSTHVREFVPLDEYARIKKDLATAQGPGANVDEDLSPELREKIAQDKMTSLLWGGIVDDSFEPFSVDIENGVTK